MNILFIPHTPNIKLINRVYEFAKSTNSYFLYWEIENSSFKEKVKSQLNSLKYKQDGKIVQIPLLFRPEKFAAQINSINLNLLIDKLDIDVVVNANALLFDIKKIKVPVIYDLVDDHLEINSDIGLSTKRVSKIKNDIKESKAVITVTNILQEKARGLNKNVITIENGVYIDKFAQAKSLKRELGLENKKVFGYIGGVDEWTGIDRACEAYMKIKSNNNAMIIVGDSNSYFFRELKRRYQDDIIFTGMISPEKVGDYFKTLDIGLIPFKLNDFTNNAFPIKALEYGLAGATVLSTPLKLLKQKSFPFIEFAKIDEFDKMMTKIDKKVYDFDFSKFSWDRQSQKLLNYLKEYV